MHNTLVTYVLHLDLFVSMYETVHKFCSGSNEIKLYINTVLTYGFSFLTFLVI